MDDFQCMKNLEKSEYPYEAPKGKVWKTNSDCEWVLVDDPDRFSEIGSFKKIKIKHTNITPKKKKRKK
jgi:hypothetical protein